VLTKADGLSYLDQLHARIESLEAQLQSAQDPGLGVDVVTPSPRDQTPHPLSINSSPSSLNGAGNTPTVSIAGSTQTIRLIPLERPEPDTLTNTLVTSEPQIKVHRYGHAGRLPLESAKCRQCTYYASLPGT
jgi:hypothetical protein